MRILVLNSGSSSIKFQLFEVDEKLEYELLCKGIVNRIGESHSEFILEKDSRKNIHSLKVKNHHDAILLILEKLTHDTTLLSSQKDLSAIGHRVVHGGERFKRSTLIDRQVISAVSKYSQLSPLHNPPALTVIEACKKIMPQVKQVAVFDTAFHQTMPTKAYLYGLPYEYYRRYGVRKYGFHGTSHHYVALKAARQLKRPLRNLKMVSCHLGNGCSITAIDGGKSVDTTMGMTPLEGLVMGTRCGDLDPACVLFLLEKERLSLKKMDEILNKQSGLLGLSGLSNDMRDILAAAKEGNARAKIALDIFIYRICKYIGAYAAVMNGMDTLIFTAGISENNRQIREKICFNIRKLLRCFKTKVLVIPTNEEWMIAHETYSIIRGK
jgi:acetate kinase